MSDLYIPAIGLPILLQENRWTDRGNILIAHRRLNVETGYEATQFLIWERINRNFFAVYHTILIKSKVNANEQSVLLILSRNLESKVKERKKVYLSLSPQKMF